MTFKLPVLQHVHYYGEKYKIFVCPTISDKKYKLNSETKRLEYSAINYIHISTKRIRGGVGSEDLFRFVSYPCAGVPACTAVEADRHLSDTAVATPAWCLAS
jgi:hypothetical protein